MSWMYSKNSPKPMDTSTKRAHKSPPPPKLSSPSPSPSPVPQPADSVATTDFNSVGEGQSSINSPKTEATFVDVEPIDPNSPTSQLGPSAGRKLLSAREADKKGKNYFDGLITCGVGYASFEVSPILLNDERARNRFAAKILAVLCAEICIAIVIVPVLQFIVPPDPTTGRLDQLFLWLAAIPSFIYFITLTVYRMLQLFKKRIINWAFVAPLIFLFITSMILMFPVRYWGLYLGSILTTLIILAVILFFQIRKIDLFYPGWLFYVVALVVSGIVSIIFGVASGFHRHTNGVIYFTESFDTEGIVGIVGIILVTIVVAMIIVYELRKMLEGRRMNLRENDYIFAAVLL